MRASHLTAFMLVCVFIVSLPALSIERSESYVKALEYVDHEWECTNDNIVGAACSPGDGYSGSDFCTSPGTYVGLPYDWGGYMTLETFDQGIAEGRGAGCHSSDGILDCTVGVDCSGYVSQLWQCGHNTTSSLSNVSSAIDPRDMWMMDAYNDAGSHVIAWEGKDENGDAIILESSGTCNGTCERSVQWSYFGSYTPMRPFAQYVETATLGSFAGTMSSRDI